METAQIWEKIAEYLKRQLSPESYDLWIKPLSPVSLEENKFTIQVPNKFFSNWIKLHHKENIENLLAELTDNKKIEIAVFAGVG